MISLKGWRILLVDDEKFAMHGIVDALDAEGAKVTQVTDGTAALRYLREHRSSPPDLLILDIMMGGGDEIKTDDKGRSTGAELYKIIRKEGMNIPVVVSTVVQDPKILNAFFQGPRDPRVTVIQKPYRFRDLLRQIDEVMGQQGGTG